ncbi:MAG: Mut7-C RNAse domain-containing protein [Phycisphaerae bacterium]
MSDEDDAPRFLCDAMLGGLARWLRAAGYDAEFEYGIDDGELVRRAAEGGQTILSSDGPLFDRNVIRHGQIDALYIPQQLSKLEQLRFVMSRRNLPLRRPRCMSCGGELLEIPKHTVTNEAPPLAFRNCEKFWRCRRCGKLLWRGTHWRKITRRLEEIAGDSTGRS